jgi:hypothetical protein
MKIKITLTGDDGFIYVGEADLNKVNRTTPTSTNKVVSNSVGSKSIDYSSVLRPFLQTYYRKGMTGAAVFTIITAHFARGSNKALVKFGDISTAWNKNRTILKMDFNRTHSNAAQGKGWITSTQRSVYQLLPKYEEAFTCKADSKSGGK